MARLISITDDRRRDAQISLESPRRAERARFVGQEGQPAATDRLIRGVDATSLDTLLRRFGDANAVSKALVAGDPEIATELVGRRMGEASRIWIRRDGEILYAARVLRVISNPSGEEISREDFVDVEATISEDGPPLSWSGRLMSLEDAVKRFVFTRKVQLKHINGLTFDFLYDMAKTLQDAGKLVYVGSGSKGQDPLIFQVNGTPYRGFLEGRVDGERYRLVLHLSNQELKAPKKAEEA